MRQDRTRREKQAGKIREREDRGEKRNASAFVVSRKRKEPVWSFAKAKRQRTFSKSASL